MGPTERYWDVPVELATVTALCGRIRRAVDQANADPTAPGLTDDSVKAAGRGLYDEFLPRLDPRVVELRNALRELQTPLRRE